MVHPGADPDAVIAGWERQIEEKLRQAEQLQTLAKEVRVTTTNRDGSISVTVDSSGNLVDLRLTGAAMAKRPAEASAEILGTLRSAQAQIAGRMREAMSPILGGDSDTMNAVMSGFHERFPVPEPDTGGPAARRRPSADPDDDFDDHNWADDRKNR
jgi:DNA-binding protein YbaB